ncbi:MAG: TolC family protein [Prevotellaceae bacterium]|nr:TolC family protein [Prevotellaceae bacterium]
MKRTIYILMVAVVTATMNSCGIYNKYQRPEIDTEGLYRTDSVLNNAFWNDSASVSQQPSDTSYIAYLSWEKLFTDPVLQNLIREGLDNNTDLNVARLKVEEAQASLTAAKLAYLPSLQFGAEGALSSFDNAKTSKTYTLGVSASWEIDVFGKLTNAKREAIAALEQSDAYRQAVQTQVVATVAESYYSLLMLDEQIEITRATVESWKEYVKTLNSLMKAGEADRATISQAEASRLSAESSLEDLLQQVNEVENSLSTFLGRKPGKIERGRLSEQVFPTVLSVGVPLDLLSNRPDVREAEASLKQAFYATNQSRSAFYPNITLSGSAGWMNNGGAVITNPGSWLLQAVGSLVQPIFNRGTLIANLKIAKAQQEEALLNFRQSLLDAGSEVNNSLTQCQTAQRKIKLDSEQVEHLETTVHDTQLLMKYGTTNYLQVLTARQSLLSARLSLVTDRYSAIEGIINLYHALGGGTK